MSTSSLVRHAVTSVWSAVFRIVSDGVTLSYPASPCLLVWRR